MRMSYSLPQGVHLVYFDWLEAAVPASAGWGYCESTLISFPAYYSVGWSQGETIAKRQLQGAFCFFSMALQLYWMRHFPLPMYTTGVNPDPTDTQMDRQTMHHIHVAPVSSSPSWLAMSVRSQNRVLKRRVRKDGHSPVQLMLL